MHWFGVRCGNFPCSRKGRPDALRGHDLRPVANSQHQHQHQHRPSASAHKPRMAHGAWSMGDGRWAMEDESAATTHKQQANTLSSCSSGGHSRLQQQQRRRTNASRWLRLFSAFRRGRGVSSTEHRDRALHRVPRSERPRATRDVPPRRSDDPTPTPRAGTAPPCGSQCAAAPLPIAAELVARFCLFVFLT
jgi:hypothetical protein